MNRAPHPFLNFNDAGAKPLDKDKIKAQLLSRLESVLLYLLPHGKVRGKQFYVGDIDGHPGKSLKVELTYPKAGQWKDFASTGDQGDIFDLWAAVKGIHVDTEFSRLLEDIGHWLCMCDANIQIPQIKPSKQTELLGAPDTRYFYYGVDGELLVVVNLYRDEHGDKLPIPWDVKARRCGIPESNRPLYNLPGIRNAKDVVIVEGEKCAEALIQLGIPATTALGGAHAPVEKTDWSILKNKTVTLWRDNDDDGKVYQEQVMAAAQAAGAREIKTVTITPGEPKGWDAADAVAEELDIEAIVADAVLCTANRIMPPHSLFNWGPERFSGKAPEQKFLVQGTIPMKCVTILAAMGDTGKGMLTLDLALKVATHNKKTGSIVPPMSLGGALLEFGTAVIYTAEDDQAEIHRRLERLDPEGKRANSYLFVVPLPNAGGPIPLVTVTKTGPVESEQFRQIKAELLSVQDLKMVVFDPMSSFIHADINADPAAGSFATGMLASLASETGAAVIVCHHLRKPANGRQITSAEQARDAIRGTSAIVDGMRNSIVLWPASEDVQKRVFKTLHEKKRHNAVFQGAVVKANGPADRAIKTFVRNEIGLLEDLTERLHYHTKKDDELENALIEGIKRSAINGHPFSHYGSTGVYNQRERLPSPFHEIGKHKMQQLVQALLNAGRLVKGRAQGSKENKWLDVQGGPFAIGDGKFRLGADETS